MAPTAQRNPGKPITWAGLGLFVGGMMVSLMFGRSIGLDVGALSVLGGWVTALGIPVMLVGGLVWLVVALAAPRRN